MKKVMCVWEEMEEPKGERQESREWGCREKRETKADENRGQVIILSTSVPCGLIQWSDSLHTRTHTHTHGGNRRWTCIDLIGVLSGPMLPCCLRVLCTAHQLSLRLTHTLARHSRIHLDSGVALHRVHVANTTICQPYRIYKFGALILWSWQVAGLSRNHKPVAKQT